MGLASTIARNVFSNATGFLVNAVVGILLTPFVESRLGDAGYGLWIMLVSFTGYYGLLDIGIRSAVGQYVTRYWAKNDLDGVSRTLSTATGLMSLGGLIVLVAGGTIAVFAPTIFNLQGVTPTTARTLFAIVAGGVALNFPLLVAQSAAYARSRFDLVQAVNITERMVFVGVAVWILLNDHGLVALAIANASVQLAANLVRVVIARRLLPGARLAVRFFDRGSVKELYGYSVFSVLINAGDTVLVHSSALVIPIVLNETALAHYGMGSLLVYQMLGLVSAIAWTITPLATASDARGDREAVRRLWLSGSRLMIAFGAVVGGGLVFAGEDFIRLWVGEDYVSGADYPSSAAVLSLLVIGALARAAMTIGRQICFGMREVRFLARLSFVEAGMTLLLGFALCKPFGILGVAAGSATATVVAQLVFMPRFLARRLEVPLGRWASGLVGPLAAVFAAMLLADRVLRQWLPITGWLELGLLCAGLAAAGGAVGVAVGTTREEKGRLAKRLLPRRGAA